MIKISNVIFTCEDTFDILKTVKAVVDKVSSIEAAFVIIASMGLGANYAFAPSDKDFVQKVKEVTKGKG